MNIAEAQRQYQCALEHERRVRELGGTSLSMLSEIEEAEEETRVAELVLFEAWVDG